MHRGLFKGGLDGRPPLPEGTRSKREDGMGKRTLAEECNAVGWDNYFDSKRHLTIPGTNSVFCVYEAGHDGPLFVLLHGGGHTALSWALVADILKASCRVIAYDCRGHGDTKTDDDFDLSASTLVADALQLLEVMYPPGDTSPPVIIVGHSMGGAIAGKLSATGKVNNQVGLIVIDVVEGTAMAALSSMHSIIASRPTSFPSLEKAIEWSLSSNTLNNVTSARVSIPPQLVEAETMPQPTIRPKIAMHPISEDEPDVSASLSPEHTPPSLGEGPLPVKRWFWRTPLARSEPHWAGWFSGLSDEFLSVKKAKMLLLAGTDRLDRALTIGQMQGKFQLTVLPKVGHVIQEDDPTNTANTLLEFARRNRWI
eukprot:TRINITY_DN4137_c0_g1_i2.p1 TRINITY_DN4137_c0_g1~~TRINITY_DN4137_c0_g1_i2.p1  ORF type:complete len:368 (+),score=52.61 TRINITY_DN4137_c0_g1_i2:27-1130(+)